MKETRFVELTREELREICVALDTHYDRLSDMGKVERAERVLELHERLFDIRLAGSEASVFTLSTEIGGDEE